MTGLRVLRGQDWSHGNDDGGEGHLGTVVDVSSDKTAKVVWDNGNQSNYSIGKGGKFELKIIDNATVGVRHTQVDCSVCGERGIFGMRWKCRNCENFNLCPICYFANKHDMTHVFIRYESPSSQGVQIDIRNKSQRMQTTGLFPGATVARGVDWDRGDEDGGAGKYGMIITIESSTDSSSARGMVRVKWQTGKSGIYNVGAKGKMDLKFVEEFPGVYYFKDHLPNLDGSLISQTLSEFEKESFKEDDIVFIKMSAEVLKKAQTEHAIWASAMVNCIGKLGVIKSFKLNGDAIVEFDGLRFALYPGVLQKVPKLSEGDIVTILNDEQMVKSLQESHGGWNTKMSQGLGKCGRVVRLDKDENVIVAFGSTTWVLNPACCIPTPNKVPDEIDESDDDTNEDNSSSSSDNDENFNEQMLVHLLRMLNSVVEPETEVTPGDMFQCAATGDAATLASLLQKAGPEMVNMMNKGLTMLVIAAHEGHNDVVQVLLEKGADIEKTDDKMNTPLSAAMIGEEPRVARQLLDKGANVTTKNKQGRTPLHLAAVAGDTMAAIVPIIIKNGCSVSAQDDDGDTALHDAIQKGNNGVVKALCDAPGINFKIFNNDGFMPLQLATLRNRVLAVHHILGKDIQTVNMRMKNVRFVALHIAATNDHLECVQLLTDKGKADLNAKGENEATPLHLACKEAFCDIVELLLEKGAEKDVKDELGNTPLHLAVSGVKQKGTLLGELGMASASENSDRVRIACLLMRTGATYNPKNNETKIPQDVAKNPDIRRGINLFIEKRRETLKARPKTPMPRERRMPTELFPDLPCAACLRKISDVTLLPCRHKILCQDCSRLVQNCPMCEEHIESRVVGKNEIQEVSCKVQ